jgi:DNA-binding transcriptional LysR family regulator
MSWDQRVGRRLKLRDPHILMEVASAGGMGKAAERLNISQPVVSKAVASLEDALGVRLLDRTMQDVELTDYGRAALKCGVAVFDDLKKGVEEIEFIADPTVGAVRIGCTEPEFASIVSAAIDRLSPRYPRIVFHLVRVDQAARSRELEIRDVDVVIAGFQRFVNNKNVDAEILYTEPAVVAVGLRSPWARRRRVALAELVNEPWVLPEAGSFIHAVVTDAFHACGLEAPRTVVVASSNMRATLLASGHFITAIPAAASQIGGLGRSIKALPVSLPDRQRPVAIFTLIGRSLSPVAKLFIECVRDIAKPLAQTRTGRGKNDIIAARSKKTA